MRPLFFTRFCLCDEAWLLLSERFTVVADFQRGGLTSSVLNIASLLGEAKIDGFVAEKLEAALQNLQAQVSVYWSSLKSNTVSHSTEAGKNQKVTLAMNMRTNTNLNTNMNMNTHMHMDTSMDMNLNMDMDTQAQLMKVIRCFD